MKIIDCIAIQKTEHSEDLDAPNMIRVHKNIIMKKRFLNNIYIDFYNQFKKLIPKPTEQSIIVEIGSGGGFIKEIIPSVITSDINILADSDLCFSAQHLPFKQNSVDCFFMLNVLHHVSDVMRCMAELAGALKPGGRLVMIEPANTLWRRAIDKKFHHEPFDIKGGWGFDPKVPLSSANSALPWIVFSRDRALFENTFPQMRIKKVRVHTPFRYLVSGGLSYPQIAPVFLYKAIKILEYLVYPLNRWLAYFQTMEVEKMY